MLATDRTLYIDSPQFTLCFHDRVTCHGIPSRVLALPFGGQGTPGLTQVTLHLYSSPVGVNAPTAGRLGMSHRGSNLP